MQYGKRPLYTPKRVWAVGDVHNKGKKLKSLLDQILPLFQPDDHLVFAGDLCDRGEDFILVVDLTSDLLLRYPGQVFFVKGNHESMIVDWYLKDKHDWMKYIRGTLEQIQQAYGLKGTESITIEDWLKDNPDVYLNHLIPYYETPEVIVTHACLDRAMCLMFGVKENPEGILDKMLGPIMWKFIDDEDENEIPEITKFRICGHQYAHHNKPRIFKDRCFIDTGCGRNDTSPCTALLYPGKKTWQSS